MKTLCISYIRVSSQEQALEGVSLAAQEERIRAYCTMRGLELTEVIVDAGVSAGKPLASRPGGKRLLEAIGKRNGPRAVIAWKLDRLFRDVVDCLSNINAWDRRGVALHLIDLGGQALDTSSAMGRMFLTMMAAIAEFERNVIGERTSAALQHKARNGEFTGTAPFGYRQDGRMIIKDDAEQAAIADMLEMQRDGMTLRAIAQELNEMGDHKPRGKCWHVNSVFRILAAQKE